MLTFPYYLLAEWMCFIASLLLLRNLNTKFWLLVKLYLFTVVITESICYYFAWIVKKGSSSWLYKFITWGNDSSRQDLIQNFFKKITWNSQGFAGINNHWIYNIFTLIEFTFGIWILSKIIKFSRIKFLCIGCYNIFYVSYALELITYRGIQTYFDKTNTLGSVIIICLSIFYYYLLFQQEEHVNLIKEPSFWFVSGYFIFYTTSISVDTFFEQLVNAKIKSPVPLRYIIMNILNLILYGFWIRAFLCLKIKEKSI